MTTHIFKTIEKHLNEGACGQRPVRPLGVPVTGMGEDSAHAVYFYRFTGWLPDSGLPEIKLHLFSHGWVRHCLVLSLGIILGNMVFLT